MAQRTGNWNLTSGIIYGRFPHRGNSSGTRVSLSGTSAVSGVLTPGFYEVYAVTRSNTGLAVWVNDGLTSAITASTKDYYIPADNSRIVEVISLSNPRIAGIIKGATIGSLCIMKMEY